jgi:hypothetical protein
MSVLHSIDGYDDYVISICPDGTQGEIIEIDNLNIMLPKKPKKTDILFHDKKKADQHWFRFDLPDALSKIKSMDEWYEMPREFRDRYTPYIEEEFRRRSHGLWFYNNGVATYVTGRHYMMLQWSKIDIGYPYYFAFQRRLFVHMAACEMDPRCLGQNFVKCRRSGYTNMISCSLVDEATQVKDKLLGIQSKTGKDAQENIFMKKVVPVYNSYPFFFKPIQDGTTNPRMELAFREPSKRLTKKNKVSQKGDALNTIINWKNTVNNAYDGEKTHRLYLDESGKWEKPADINEAWRIEKTCLIVGRKIIGKAYVGSTVNPMDKGGAEYKVLYYDSDPRDRNENGRTKSGLYSIFIPAYEALEGFFDKYGNCIEYDPESPIDGIDGIPIEIGSKTYLRNERASLKGRHSELNELIRQFPWTIEEAFRDSIESSLFNVGRIYEQIDYNDNMYPSPLVRGNFIWKVKDKEVVFSPDKNGRFLISWMPKPEDRNKVIEKKGKPTPGNPHIGVGGVDSYDLDQTVDDRGSKGALHLYNKFNMHAPSNMFVLEYASRPELASIFYEDVLMAAFYYGYPLLIENNKYGIARYFETRGFDEYLMDRPEHLKVPGAKSVRTKGIPSNSVDVIQSHAQAIEAHIHDHVGDSPETGEPGNMFFNRTLEDWIAYRIDKRTKYDLTISSGLCLLAAQKVKVKEEQKSDFSNKEFLRRFKPKSYHS